MSLTLGYQNHKSPLDSESEAQSPLKAEPLVLDEKN